MATTTEEQKLLGQLRAARRWHPDDLLGEAAIRQQIKALRAERAITEMVESWPPLSADQRDRLALLLVGAA
jgi:hypothetical protein